MSWNYENYIKHFSLQSWSKYTIWVVHVCTGRCDKNVLIHTAGLWAEFIGQCVWLLGTEQWTRNLRLRNRW